MKKKQSKSGFLLPYGMKYLAYIFCNEVPKLFFQQRTFSDDPSHSNRHLSVRKCNATLVNQFLATKQRRRWRPFCEQQNSFFLMQKVFFSCISRSEQQWIKRTAVQGRHNYAGGVILFLVCLEHDQYKNDATQLKNFQFQNCCHFPSPCRRRKKGGNFKTQSSSTELRRSYIDCALIKSSTTFFFLCLNLQRLLFCHCLLLIGLWIQLVTLFEIQMSPLFWGASRCQNLLFCRTWLIARQHKRGRCFQRTHEKEK